MDAATLYLIEYQDGYAIAAAGQTVAAALADAYAVTERDPRTIARVCLQVAGFWIEPLDFQIRDGKVVVGGSTVPDGLGADVQDVS